MKIDVDVDVDVDVYIDVDVYTGRLAGDLNDRGGWRQRGGRHNAWWQQFWHLRIGKVGGVEMR